VGEDLEDGRPPGAAGTDERRRLVRARAEVHVIEDSRITVAEGNPVVLDAISCLLEGDVVGVVRLREFLLDQDLEIEFETDDGESSLELELEWPSPTDERSTVLDEEDPPEGTEPAEGEEGPGDEDRSARTVAVGDGDQSEGEDVSVEEDMPAGEEVSADSDASRKDDLPDAGDDVSMPVGAANASESLARFEVFRDRADEWRWRLRHRNGNVIAAGGEGYTRKHNARKNLRSVIRNAPDAEITEDASG
jgi:uncharacterized protein YegP (UPF0339 family)